VTPGSPAAASVTVPLFALRPDLSGGWPAGSRWSIPDPGQGTSVEQPEGSVLSYRIRGAAGARLRARVALLVDDPPPAGAIRARVVVVAGSDRRELWSGLLPVVAGHVVKGPIDIAVDLDEDGECLLLLCASHLRSLGRSGVRLRWEEPRLEIPATDQSDEDHHGTPAVERVFPRAPTSDPDPIPSPREPLFSILTPVHNPPPRILEETLQSVRGQTFQGWEMRLVDDASTDPQVIRILEAACEEDDRIHLVRREKSGGISAATNTALRDAKGEYIALLDHDDVLTEDALATVAATIAADPTIDILYTDEEVFDEDQRLALFLKPNWSPDLMCSHMYTCHLGVYRRRLADEVGGFRSEFDGSQDYDFLLRVSETTDRIVHIPQVLYRWRSHKGSVAENVAAKPHAFAAARQAIAEHLDRLGVEAEVHFDAMRFWYRVEYPFDDSGRVALIYPVPPADGQAVDALRRAVEAWARIDDVDWDLVLVGVKSDLDRYAASLAEIDQHRRLRLVAVDPGLGRASMLNRAVLATDAETLVLLDHPVEQLTSHWLRRLQGIADQESIGAVAAKTLAADGRVEHAGLVINDGLPVPVQMGADQIEPGPMAILYVRGNFSTVSGTVATSRRTLTALGGFDERFDLLAVADYCLRAWESGLRVISEASAVVRRTDGTPAPNDLSELAAFRAHWRGRLAEDPYFDERARAVLTGVGPAR
jgi:O-antigen biosynthesis protein